MNVEIYAGGMADTNGYLVSKGNSAFVVDAPEGMTSWLSSMLEEKDLKLEALLLTHGHWDHILDALSIQQRLKIPVIIHADSAPLLESPEIQAPYNPFCQLDVCKADRILNQEKQLSLSNFSCELFLCPGHCPGSLCFYFKEDQMLFDGDVLFAGAVGRWDLPGGSQKQLFDGITRHLLTLPDTTQVFPGHGPSTTIGREKKTNPYLQK